ncbi:MAG: amidase family protein, partial [Actinomycetota bacterium]
MNDPIWIERRAEVEVASAVAAVKRGPEAGRPLAGLTLAIKDNIDVEGFVTTAGCPSYAYRPSRSATAVRRLQDAGAVIVGKTNLDQFATGLVGTRSPYGVVENPLRPGLIAGGSSSGSAAAVACRAADIGVGTDTAGSGRVPAALCGLVGLKGTPGLVPTTGVVPACPSFDCTTVMASDLAVAVAALRTMAGTDRDDPRSRPAPTGPAPLVTRVGIPSPETLIGCSDEVLAVHEAAIDGLRRTGLTVQTVGVETLSPYFAAGALLYGGA